MFLVKIRPETRFNSILDRKETFFDYKKFFSSPKNRIFPKGLTHALGEKMLNVSLFRFRQEKMLNNFVQKKDTFFTFLVQNWPFFHRLFLANIGQENVFHDILERKNAFLGYKNREFKKRKNCDFFKGANPWFWSKIGHFSTFFLGNIGQETLFYDILERENTSLGYKNKKLKKSKNCDFCKGVNPWFWSKIGHFSIFFF